MLLIGHSHVANITVMNLKDFLASLPHGERKAFATRVGTSYPYLYQIAHGLRTPSPEFCRRLIQADDRLTLADLRPDIWDERKGAA